MNRALLGGIAGSLAILGLMFGGSGVTSEAQGGLLDGFFQGGGGGCQGAAACHGGGDYEFDDDDGGCFGGGACFGGGQAPVGCHGQEFDDDDGGCFGGCQGREFDDDDGGFGCHGAPPPPPGCHGAAPPPAPPVGCHGAAPPPAGCQGAAPMGPGGPEAGPGPGEEVLEPLPDEASNRGQVPTYVRLRNGRIVRVSRIAR